MVVSSLYQQLCLLTTVVSALLTLAVYSHAVHDKRNVYLAGIMLVSALAFGARYLFYIQSVLLPYLPVLVFPLIWFQGLLYLRYLELCLGKASMWPRLKYILMLCAMLSGSIHLALVFRLPEFSNHDLIQNQGGIIGLYSAVHIAVVSSFQAFILLTSWFVLRLWHKQQSGSSDASQSGSSRELIRWLILLDAVLLLNYLIYAGSALLSFFAFLRSPFHLFEVAYNAVLVFLILYYLFRKPVLLQLPAGNPSKYTRQSLSESDARQYRLHLLAYMEAERPWLKEDLSLKELARLTQIPAHHLSIIINRDLGQNFFSFLADYRVAEARRLMADPDHKETTLLSICYAAGFQSKSAFNSAFKKSTGLTPTQYRQQVKSW
ncbi:MAG: helix-turn-helix transcriptional regulator [Leptospiraceae bacterium]|nr:helix-turn-helix transcriptional regulator [Leptospiraceae bacterium]